MSCWGPRCPPSSARCGCVACCVQSVRVPSVRARQYQQQEELEGGGVAPLQGHCEPKCCQCGMRRSLPLYHTCTRRVGCNPSAAAPALRPPPPVQAARPCPRPTPSPTASSSHSSSSSSSSNRSPTTCHSRPPCPAPSPSRCVRRQVQAPPYAARIKGLLHTPAPSHHPKPPLPNLPHPSMPGCGAGQAGAQRQHPSRHHPARQPFLHGEGVSHAPCTLHVQVLAPSLHTPLSAPALPHPHKHVAARCPTPQSHASAAPLPLPFNPTVLDPMRKKSRGP